MRKLTLLALVLAFAACRDTSSSGDDTPGVDSNGGGSADVKIQDIQNPAMTSGTPVNLKGVVVTAIDNYGAKTGDFWVQEPEGGEFSGIHVYGAPLDAVGALEIGTVVDISGAEKDEFEYSDFEPGFGITELKPLAGGMMTVQSTGVKMVLQPQLVNALMIGGLPDYQARADEWEKWEGVLITIENVRATTDQACVGSACNDPKLQKVEVTGDVVVESAISAFPYNNTSPMAFKRGDCINKVTGVLDYFFDYLLLPRDTNEYGMEGGNCPTEDTAAACSDGMDNDGNGFMDCADNACIVSQSSCRTVTNIQAIQTASTPPTGGIEIQGVCVSALGRATGMTNPTPKNLWIQTSNTTASANNGLYVRGDGSDYSAFTAGKKVNVIGTVREFDGSSMAGTGTLTQLQALKVELAAGTCTPTPVTNQLAATLTVDLTGEPLESVLVEMDNVKITTQAMANFFVGEMSQAGTAFKFDDDIFQLTAPVDTCYASITGIWSYNSFDNYWVFFPLAAGTTTGGNCP